ncbi:MAG: hypothetical protein IKR91_05720 [Alloprevotella sp.]|nr:hypothetical protein [Alloprevotella sp.]
MKKFFLTLALVVVATAANAQVWIGGEIGAWRDYKANITEFTLRPEVGYNLDSKWSLGLAFGYQHEYLNHQAINTVEINPYARFSYAKFGPVSLFLDGGFAFGVSKVKDVGDGKNWEVGIKPGFAITLNQKFGFVSHVGFLGWRDHEYGVADNGFGFKLSGYDVTFGVYYNF